MWSRFWWASFLVATLVLQHDRNNHNALFSCPIQYHTILPFGSPARQKKSNNGHGLGSRVEYPEQRFMGSKEPGRDFTENDSGIPEVVGQVPPFILYDTTLVLRHFTWIQQGGIIQPLQMIIYRRSRSSGASGYQDASTYGWVGEPCNKSIERIK